MPSEQLFLTAADYSMCCQPNITPSATISQEFCLVVTITVFHTEVAGYATEILSCWHICRSKWYTKYQNNGSKHKVYVFSYCTHYAGGAVEEIQGNSSTHAWQRTVTLIRFQKLLFFRRPFSGLILIMMLIPKVPVSASVQFILVHQTPR